MTKTTAFLLPFLLLPLLGSGPAAAEDPPGPDLDAAARAAGTVNGLCPVMRRPVTPGGGSVEYRGEKIGFCCPGCDDRFRSDPVRYMDRMRTNPARYAYRSKWPTLREMEAAAEAARTANGLCPVMGRLVQPDGGAVEHEGQRVGFCCPGCDARFRADPAGYLRAMRADPKAFGYDRPGPSHAELRQAREAAGTANGLCPVMRRLVTPGGGHAEHRGERIGFCCPPCRARFLADPEAHMAPMRLEPAVYGYLPGAR